MSDTDRLHEIIDNLPPQQIHALLALLETSRPVDAETFSLLPANVDEEDIDAGTAARLRAAEVESGEYISHDELKSQLGL